jgi:hypothetical protein
MDERERRTRLAREFHHLVHQHLLGLPPEALSASIHDPELERWWRAYLAYIPALRGARILPEVALSTPLAGYRLRAQYDAIAIRDGSPVEGEETEEAALERPAPLLIVDWKTYHRRPTRDWLAKRLQTRVYPAVLVQAGVSLAGQPTSSGPGPLLEPEDVEMRYWFAEYPLQPTSFGYDAPSYQADIAYVSALITEIAARIDEAERGAKTSGKSASDEIWPLTSDLHECRYCNYRSLCGRGDVAGPLDETIAVEDQDDRAAGAGDLDFDLSWDQVQEIAY